MGLIHSDWCPYKKRDLDTQRDTRATWAQGKDKVTERRQPLASLGEKHHKQLNLLTP